MTETMDDNDRKKAGLELDPLEGTEKVETADRTPKPMLDLRSDAFTLNDLEAAEKRALVSIADLPQGHGWGDTLNDAIGGGLAPGQLIAVGASRAGAGKTAFLMQLADGLALRSAELVNAPADPSAPLTPVLILSEMSAADLSFRTLGRLLGRPARMFRSGPAAVADELDYLERKGEPPDPERAAARVDELFRQAKAQLQDGDLARIATWQKLGRPDGHGADMLEILAGEVNAWKATLAETHGRDVWPVVIVDPIQRWQIGKVSEVEALNELVERLDALADEHGWIAFMTSDTNKEAAKNAALTGQAERQAAPNLFRGSYKLHHSADVVMVLQPQPSTLVDIEKPTGPKIRWAAVELDKNRWGPNDAQAWFKWEPASGRFTAKGDPPEEVRTAFENAGEKKPTVGGGSAGRGKIAAGAKASEARTGGLKA